MGPSLPEHETGLVPSGDVEIFYRRFGKPGKSPALIVHGLSFFSYDWIGPAAAIAVDREVVAIDMRGFGNSSWSPARDYKLETLSQDLINLLDHFGWREAVLIGHSFGGRVCLATSAWHPQRAAALICVDFAPDLAAAGRRHVAERIGRQPEVFASVDAALSYHGHPDEPAGSPIRARYEAFLKPTPQGYVLRRDLYYRDNFKRALETGKPAPHPHDLWGMLAELKLPILVLRGTNSDMFEPQTLDKARAANPRVTGLEIQASHDIAGDNPDTLVLSVRTFLQTAGV
jgi:pimeloyl-ACP methyl ester carboxylesterase